MGSSRSWTDNKWTTTAASIWIQCTSGCPYTFSIYSAALKSTQHYDQSTLDTVSVFKDIGASAGILSGIVYTAATSFSPSSSSRTTRRGPWIVLAAGAIQCFAGYFLMWLSVAELLPRPPVALMCFYMFMAAHATSFFNTGNVVTGVNNFPNYRGTIVGIMKGFLGLSGSMLIQVYQTILEDNPTAYILMLALLPTCNALLLMWFVRIYRESEGDEDKQLDRFSFVSVVVAAYLLIIIILDNALSLPSPARICTFVILVMLLTSPFYVAMKAYLSDSRRISGSSYSGHQIDDSNLLASEIYSDIRHAHSGYDQVPCGTVREVEEKTIDKKTLQWGENLNLVQAICTSSFWLLFIAAACGMGSGLATVNNISQIGASLGYTTSETSSMVSLWGIWNYIGRFGAGYLSEYLLHVNGWARPLFMTITLASMSIGHVVIASAFPGSLYIGSFLVGVFYGSQWSLMPTIVSEIFGVVHMGTIFNTITAAGPIGSYILSVRVIGYIYDVESSVEGGSSCSGTQCFRLSFFILSSATLLGSLAALTLFFLTKDFYQQAIVRRLHSVRE